MNDDLISRKAAIDAAKKLLDYYGADDISKEFADHTAEQFMNRVPSTQPERKKGQWIPVTNGRGGFECNQCHCYAPSYQDGVEWLSAFCPNCGADMRGEKRMTDIEMERLRAICAVANVDDIEDLSDGCHTFRQLYYQRMMLFAAIVKQNKDKAWKSLRHEDGELCFGGGWFIVGVDTPEGSYTYHYEDNYFSLFDCEELACGKHWDGHTDKDVTRLMSLQP